VHTKLDILISIALTHSVVVLTNVTYDLIYILIIWMEYSSYQ